MLSYSTNMKNRMRYAFFKSLFAKRNTQSKGGTHETGGKIFGEDMPKTPSESADDAAVGEVFLVEPGFAGFLPKDNNQ